MPKNLAEVDKKTRINWNVSLGRLKLASPVLVASGTFGYGTELKSLFPLDCLGAIVTKTVTRFPRAGNPPPRLAETPAGLLNSIGLQNVGWEVFAGKYIPEIVRLGPPIIVSIAGESVEEFVYLAGRLAKIKKIAAIELNISCPNLRRDNRPFASEPAAIQQLIQRIKQVAGLPLIVKLPPVFGSLPELARAAEKAGATAVALINTFPGMAVDVERERPRLSTVTGGLSGPAIRPLAVRAVWEVRQAVSLPIIGMGGILNGKDALEFILVGANAVALGTVNLINPRAPQEVLNQIQEYCQRKGVRNFAELVGKLQQNETVEKSPS